MVGDIPSPLDIITRQATESPHLVNDSRAPLTLGVAGALTGFSTLIVILRVYVRALVLKHFGTDDYLIVFASMCALGVLACLIGESKHGLGRYSKFITDWAMLSKWTYARAIIIVVGISLVKISLGFFLFRFAARTRFRWFIIGTVVFLIAFTLACVGALVFQCVPVEAVWNFELKAHANCFSGETYTSIGLFNSIINIITDVLFATMPVPMFYNIQVNKRTKVSLMFILSLGYLACAAAIVKAVFQVQVFDNSNPYRNDYLLWNDIELNLGILAASLPTLKPIFKTVIGSTRNLTSGRKNTSNGYYIRQGSGIAMQSLHSQSRGPGTGAVKGQKYDVQVSAARRSIPGSMDSEEALYATQTREHGYESPQADAAIMRTTEVIVERDNRSRHGNASPRFGRRDADNWI